MCHVSLESGVLHYNAVFTNSKPVLLHAELIKPSVPSVLRLSLFADMDTLPWQRPLLATS